MKQLKFMLAAATAISLATATQAGDLNGSTDFEFADSDYKVGDTFPKAGEAGWTVPATGNDSTIAEVAKTDFGNTTAPKKYADGDHTKGLSVSTAGGALLRNIKGSAGSESLASGQIYIDTMVQFTPTAAGEEPVEGSDDKLMIYLLDTSEGDVKSTSLKVRASLYRKGYVNEDEGIETDPVHTPQSVEVVYAESQNGALEVEKNCWYRLTVTATARDGIALFAIYLDGKQLKPVSPLYADSTGGAEDYLFPSIVMGDTITAVGFAGEGMVDDLAMTTDNPFVSTVDFTLTLGDGVSSVTWTIGEGNTTITATTPYKGVVAGTYKITDVQYADWYTADGDYQIGSNVVVSSGGNVTVGAKLKTADEIGVNNPGGASDATVTAALAWAKDVAKKSTTDVAGAANLVANYLLNVANLDVEPKIEIVEVNPATSEAPMTIKVNVTDAKGSTFEKVIVGEGAATDLNADIKYRAAATLEALKTADLKEAIEADDKFVQVVVE